jgi:hypothetical protein
MKRLARLLPLFVGLMTLSVASAARADSYEIVTKCRIGPCDPSTFATATAQSLKQYNHETDWTTGVSKWIYFTVHLDTEPPSRAPTGRVSRRSAR